MAKKGKRKAWKDMTEAEQAEIKKHREEKLADAEKKLEEGVTAILDSEAFKEYLAFLSRFHRYSANNTLLIHMANPEATMVAGYHDWRKKFGRHVRKGERGISILAPIKRKITDEASGEEKVIPVGFTTTAVFDVSQTDGDELPAPPDAIEVDGDDTNGLWERICEVVRKDVKGARMFDSVNKDEFAAHDGLKGWYDRPNRQIYLRPGMKEVSKTKTAIHEFCHHVLHGWDKKITDVGLIEMEAEGTAFVVLNHFGFDTGDYSFPYVARYGKDRDKFKSALATIQKASDEIITKLEEVEVDAWAV